VDLDADPSGRPLRAIDAPGELGYIDGGLQTLVDPPVEHIEQGGGTIRLGEPVHRIVVEDGRATGVETANGTIAADAVISTVPTPYVDPLLADLPAALREPYARIENIGVTCVVMRLKRSVSPHFWVNVSDPEMPIPGIIEFSNLRPAGNGDAVVYVPYYMPTSNPLWGRPNETFLEEAFGCLKRISPALEDGDVIASHVGRLKHAQPVCPPGFAAMIPPVQTPIAGLQIADTCFYYPGDRGIAESVRLGREMADAI
jgi:protoporphyrinogen oxidase